MVTCIAILLSSFYYTPPSGILDIFLCIGTMEMAIFVEVTVGCVSWYIIEEVVRASVLLLVISGSMHVSYVCAWRHVSI